MEGISFRYDNISFKGSQIDRKYSFGNLKKEIEKNLEESKRRGREEYLREQVAEKAEQEAKQQVPPAKRNIIIKGVELTDEQQETLMTGGYTYLENMASKDDKTKFSSFVFLNEEKNWVFFSRENPETFVKYGQYEMRIRDRMLIEAGYATKATVKWWGGGYAHPYLWKENKSDAEYRESWSDPRFPKTQKEEQKVKPVKVQKKNRGRRM